MKANEAPERVWIDPTNDLPKPSGHIDKDSVEYIRKDAFIKRATEWIDKNAFRYVVTRKYQGLDVTGLDSSLAVNFKKALEDMI